MLLEEKVVLAKVGLCCVCFDVASEDTDDQNDRDDFDGDHDEDKVVLAKVGLCCVLIVVVVIYRCF